MKRNQFLKQEVVNDFVNWLSNKINTTFNHSYFNRKRKKYWTCNSFGNAVEGENDNKLLHGYEWNGKNYEENKTELNILKNDARGNLNIEVCNRIITWGGISVNTAHYMGNDVIAYLNKAKQRLNIEQFDMNNTTNLPHINSSYTKIYSLIIDDFIIYDSRVGAAMGLLVKQFYNETKRVFIESEFEFLRFAWGSPQMTKDKNKNAYLLKTRNPTIGNFNFPKLTSSTLYSAVKLHTLCNVKASWILKEVVLRARNASFLIEDDGLRKLEAALFMIGYDVWGEKQNDKNRVKTQEEKSNNHPIPINNEYDYKEYFTLSRAKKFSANFSGEGIKLIVGEGTKMDFEARKIQKTLNHFAKKREFDLGALAHKPTPNGLGEYFSKEYKISPVFASHISSVLVAHGFMKYRIENNSVKLSVINKA